MTPAIRASLLKPGIVQAFMRTQELLVLGTVPVIESTTALRQQDVDG
jgi:hypothetical protein